MDATTSLAISDHSSEKEQMSAVLPPILTYPGIATVVILTPDANDPMFADLWEFSFDILAAKFAMFGVHAIAAPWMTTPLPSDSAYSFIYIANLAWGYHYDTKRWITWLHAWPKEAKLINSSSLLLWNTRKTYLQDLEKAGVPVIPTLYTDCIDEKTLISAAEHFSTSDLIVKPQISACSFNMVRVLLGSTTFAAAPKSLSPSAAVAELTRLGAAHSMMMIQPFMDSITQEGEVSVFVFGGKISHAVRSNTKRDDYRVQFEHGGVTTPLKEPSTEMLQLIRDALAVCPETPVYARVDMVRQTTTGHLCVNELELIEPNLYLEHALDGGVAFVQAVLQASSRNSS